MIIWPALSVLADSIKCSTFAFPQSVDDMGTLASEGGFDSYPALMGDLFKYLSKVGVRGRKPNFEGRLAARFNRVHTMSQAAIRKAQITAKLARLSCVFPVEGIQDNTVNRLLLMSSAENYLPSVPMAFFIQEQTD
jgi:hypothetical protein